jgi:hypothetical protein
MVEKWKYVNSSEAIFEDKIKVENSVISHLTKSKWISLQNDILKILMSVRTVIDEY